MRIAVCHPQVPFERGGAEILSEGLVRELQARDHEAELITIPFRWYPGSKVLSQALLWRLADLTEAQGRPIELVVATKFPSYAVRHPNKVVWLVHQFRQAYELDGTELGQFDEDPAGRAARNAVQRLDEATLGEARRLFAISANVAGRLRDSTGLEAEVLSPPPQDLPFRCDAYGDFVLSVGRLDRAKRLDLLLRAVGERDGLRVVIAGDGPEREPLQRLAEELRLDGRVTFTGRIDEQELTDLYAECLAVYYAPIDEDLGLVPFEAFRSEKPVVTTSDAGGPLEVVSDRATGLVVDPTAVSVAEAFSWLDANRGEAQELGRRGRELAEQVTWDAVVERLLSS
ncbi:MAG TPA: glycosyltransferase family 4 protein [Gaiellaceae bacterium]|jgi:glycosyltransferase involved in cell wall biosynthesis